MASQWENLAQSIDGLTTHVGHAVCFVRSENPGGLVQETHRREGAVMSGQRIAQYLGKRIKRRKPAHEFTDSHRAEMLMTKVSVRRPQVESFRLQASRLLRRQPLKKRTDLPHVMERDHQRQPANEVVWIHAPERLRERVSDSWRSGRLQQKLRNVSDINHVEQRRMKVIILRRLTPKP
ncbi:MAG TPA: hypothetical protein VHA53_07610 [Nitrolancea sp.]|nr:hypothetical protein [Nitrolancea sp.]